jgi:hypothetical protein
MKKAGLKPTFILGVIILLVGCGGEPVKKMVTKLDSLTLKPVESDTINADRVKADSPPAKEVTPKQETEVEPGRKGNFTEGVVYYTLPYCGGARPSEEIVADKKKERLLTNSVLKLVAQSGNDYLVTTNEKGIFVSGILPGTYDVYLTEKTNKTIYDVSPDMCENCLTRKMTTVTLTKDVQTKIVVHFFCAPGDKKRP